MRKPDLIVALDIPSSEKLPALLEMLPEEIRWYKVGLELFTADGLSAIELLRSRGKEIFLDLKLHDIPRTVAHAVASASRHGIGMLTLHASGGRAMLETAAESSRKTGPGAPKLVAVTALTSQDKKDIEEIGVSRSLKHHVSALAEMAIESGADGLVASAREAAGLRGRFGNDIIIVTPGIRPANSDSNDQKRIATPALAVRSGSNFLVVGRPILGAPDPASAARAILNEIEKACGAD